jgi:DNA-binding winged helix-turn-helix (wHTH) protein
LQLSETGAPAILSGSAAKPFFGPAFQDLLATKVIIERSPAQEWSTCDACECNLAARPIRDTLNGLVAQCPLDAAADTALEPEDLRSFEIDIGALVTKMAEASGLAYPKEVANQLWFLGLSPRGQATFVITRATTIEGNPLMDLLRRVAAGSPITLLGGVSKRSELERLVAAGIHHVPLSEACLSDYFVLESAKLSPTTAVAAKFILSKPEQKVLSKGFQICLPPRSFKILWLLAKALVDGKPLVTHREIERCVWGAIVVDKRAVADAVRHLRDETKPLSPHTGPEQLIETRHGQGYMLNLRADEVQLIS